MIDDVTPTAPDHDNSRRDVTATSSEDASLIDKCADIQLKLGVDDVKWKELFGNDKGLLGFVQQQTDAAIQKHKAEHTCWPIAKPDPYFHAHACRVCSPGQGMPGPGCINCRQTGYDQTPCPNCPGVIQLTQARQAEKTVKATFYKTDIDLGSDGVDEVAGKEDDK